MRMLFRPDEKIRAVGPVIPTKLGDEQQSNNTATTKNEIASHDDDRATGRFNSVFFFPAASSGVRDT